MAEPFLAEIRLVSFSFAPRGWATADGQLLPINQNQALFSLLGTTFGGDGRVNFGLPDFRGRTPLHVGGGHTLGERGGEQNHTLSIGEIPTHLHGVQASGTAAQASVGPVGNLFARATTQVYRPLQQGVALSPAAVANVGGSQAHPNMQPYLVLNFVIALQGIFPSPN